MRNCIRGIEREPFMGVFLHALAKSVVAIGGEPPAVLEDCVWPTLRCISSTYIYDRLLRYRQG